MKGMGKLQETFKALEKQLIRAKADHAELLVDGKEVSSLHLDALLL